MRSGTSQARILDDPEEPLTELQYFCKAADLLQQMFIELQFLATRNPILAYTMFDGESDACLHLRSLLETIHELLAVDDPSMRMALQRRAATLLLWLSSEVDHLMACAARGDGYVNSCECVLH